mmetsp:Transcript_7591/g.15608  ORF Transcript_7591/g.15608 Transcript_7591/m.15608 type:complete len:85 (-) Transcript_7591:9-263(-)
MTEAASSSRATTKLSERREHWSQSQHISNYIDSFVSKGGELQKNHRFHRVESFGSSNTKPKKGIHFYFTTYKYVAPHVTIECIL